MAQAAAAFVPPGALGSTHLPLSLLFYLPHSLMKAKRQAQCLPLLQTHPYLLPICCKLSKHRPCLNLAHTGSQAQLPAQSKGSNFLTCQQYRILSDKERKDF